MTVKYQGRGSNANRERWLRMERTGKWVAWCPRCKRDVELTNGIPAKYESHTGSMLTCVNSWRYVPTRFLQREKT